MLTAEDPQQHGPRDHRSAQALHGAIATPWAGPAGQAQHADASGHDEQGGYDLAQWSEHRCRDRGSEAFNLLRVFRSPGASRISHRRRQQRHTIVMWSEKWVVSLNARDGQIGHDGHNMQQLSSL